MIYLPNMKLKSERKKLSSKNAIHIVLIARMERKALGPKVTAVTAVCDLFSDSVISTLLILQEAATVLIFQSTSECKWIY